MGNNAQPGYLLYATAVRKQPSGVICVQYALVPVWVESQATSLGYTYVSRATTCWTDVYVQI